MSSEAIPYDEWIKMHPETLPDLEEKDAEDVVTFKSNIIHPSMGKLKE
jgi:hypothetical protein